MARITSSIRAEELASIVDDPARGIVSLVGDNGGLSLITGEIKSSALVHGNIVVLTEHGNLYLDPESWLNISEDTGDGAGDGEQSEREWLVSWSIDSEATTPERAAAKVWFDTFGRTAAAADDACVFTVHDPQSNQTHEIDLSDYDLSSLSD